MRDAHIKRSVMLEFHIRLGSGTEYRQRSRSILFREDGRVTDVGWAESCQLILVSAFSRQWQLCRHSYVCGASGREALVAERRTVSVPEASSSERMFVSRMLVGPRVAN